MKSILIGLNLLLLFGINVFYTFAQQSPRTPVIVELFTSEGCETCPPADKYLSKLLKEQPIPGVEIIALNEHVDYWNRPEWTDKFSSPQFSNRQKYYAVFFKRDEIFTPQLVVDGTREITAKDGNKLLAESTKNSKATVDLRIREADERSIKLNINIENLPVVPNQDKTLVLVAVTENNLASNVTGGENGGRKLEHSAVVRYMKTVGELQAGIKNLSAQIEFGKDWKRENLSIVAFVQAAQSRQIIGAAKVDLQLKK